jgi:hypothetical protein
MTVWLVCGLSQTASSWNLASAALLALHATLLTALPKRRLNNKNIGLEARAS